MDTPRLIPLTFSQQRIWFITQLDPESCAYNCPVAIKLGGDTNYQALDAAFLQVIQRHSSLRTNFTNQTGTPYQVINQQNKFQLQLVDISTIESSQINLKIQQLAQEEAATLFDLTTDSLIRGKLLKISDRQYILLVTIHHIIWDYWSWWLLWQEISTVYNAIAEDKDSTLKPLAMDYGEYSLWQQQQVTTPEWQEQKAYWSDRFRGEIPLLDLPEDRKRPLMQTYRGASQKITISPNLSKQLQQIAFKTRTSLFIVFLAAYKSWLLRYTNQTDLIVGIPVANRQHLNTKSLIGCFVNTLPIRSNLADHPHFFDLVQQVAQAVLVANENQLYPFEELIKTLNLKRDLSRSPLFQTVFMFREDITKGLNLSGISTEALAISETTAKFDLTVCVYPTSESCQIEFEYNTDLFEAETIERMMNNFVILLESIVSQTVNQSLPITQLNLLTQQEKQLLQNWNATTQQYPNNSCIHHLIETQVAHNPEKIAVVSGQQQLTYTQLNQQANQLARYLQQKGATVNTLVGISLQRSPLLLIALLAVLKAGAAYVPLDPNYPSERLSLMLEDSQLPILLTTANLAETIPNFTGNTINLDTDWAKIEQEATDNLNSPVTPDDLAYIIYTSGSTGKPKGVQLWHRGVVNFLSSMVKEPGITPEDILLAVTSISFDIAVLELFLPLSVGAKVIIAQDSETNNGIKLLKLIPQAGVTMMQATPATWKMLQAGKWQQIQPLKMLCGGEAMSEELADWMLENASSVWNVYGPTEATVWATVHQVRPQQTPIPIGKPLANTQIQILDSYGQLVPIGVPGEIHIGGVQLAKGYLNRPELTAEKFIPNPFEFTTKLYKTGDLGRYLNNGTIECLGRLDNQVKVRGFRIELGEIEVNLMLHPAIDNCVVIAREDIPGDKRLVAYLIAQSQPKAAELRSFLQEKLLYYMIPAHFVILEQFPLTPNGKIDRKALPALQIFSDRSINQFIAPRNKTESQLAAIWCNLLNVKQVSLEDNFFDLGGHSLLAIQLLAQIGQMYKVDVSLRTLFENPTLSKLSSILDCQQQLTPSSLKSISKCQEAKTSYPLSYAQARIWFLGQLIPNSPVYNITKAYRIKGKLNLAALEKSFQTIIQRHEILRTTVTLIDNQPQQIIKSEVDFKLSPQELEHLTNKEQIAQQILNDDAQKPFDLTSQELLFRVHLLTLDSEEFILGINFNHLICDAWSLKIIDQELAESYLAFCQDRSPKLLQLPIQYCDYAVWQKQNQLNQSQLTYWKQNLSGQLQPLQLLTDFPRPSIFSYQGAIETLELSPQLNRQLNNFKKQEKVTLSTLLLTAFKILLYCYSGQEDLIVGTAIANRQQPETAAMMGCLINSLAIRTNLAKTPTFQQFLAQVHEVTLEAYQNQDVPFEKIIEELQPERNLSYTPLFQVMFIFDHLQQNSPILSGCQTTPLELHSQTAKFDLTLDLKETPTGIRGRFEYNTDLFQAKTIQQMRDDLINLLENLLVQPEINILQLNLIKQKPKPQSISITSKNNQVDAFVSSYVAPRNQTETKLTEIWQETLKIQPIGIEDNFFELGGHSLLAVSLFRQIETVFQQQLPLATLFTAPTIKQLAQVLETEVNQDQWRSLVAIKPEGSKIPLFSFHALGGNVLNYRQLATYLDAEQPFYALQAPGLDGNKVFNKIEDLASYYIQEMQSVQAKGPYRLTGYSFGAIIAYEVARQLEQQGEEIALLAIIDMKGPDTKVNSSNWLKFHLYNLAQLTFNERLNYIRGKVGAKKDSKKEVLKLIYRITRRLAKRAGLIKVDTYQQVTKNNRQAWQKYQFPPYGGKATLFRTNLGMSALHTDHQGGWGKVVLGGVEIHEICGDHSTLFEPPYVQNLAAKLQACLDN